MSTSDFMRRLLREQPIRFTLVVLTLGVASLLEGIGVAAIVPLLDLLAGGPDTSGTVGRLVQRALDAVGVPFDLLSVLSFILAFVVAQHAATLVQQKLVNGSIFRFEARLRRSLYEGIFNASWPFFTKEKTAEIVNALTTEATRASGAYNHLNQMLGAVIVVLTYVLLAVFLSWQMTLLVVLAGLSLNLALRGMVKKGSTFGKAVTEMNGEVQHEAIENVSAAKMVKGSGMEEAATDRFYGIIERLAGQQYQMRMSQAWLRGLYETISIAVVFVGIYVAARYFKMPLSGLVVFLLIFYRVSPRLSNIQLLQHNVLTALPALDRIDGLVSIASSYTEQVEGAKVPPLSRGIEFKQVDFAYEPGKPTLRSVDLVIEHGRTTAIVGPSGAGKTTVIDLVMRLVEPTGGLVLVDGVDLCTVHLKDWRRRIGYVAQDAVLFHSTVRDNIAWGLPDTPMDEVERAARFANADDFIAELPHGYDTIVGDRGVRLSGGQKQRIALARAIVRKPEILILDEATSALDAESERRIQEAVLRLAEEITIVTVTHRLATVRDADRVYFLEAGRVVESGTWDELVSRGTRFAEVRKLQQLEDPGPSRNHAEE